MSQEKSERKPAEPNPISSKKVLGHGPIAGKLRPSAKDDAGTPYFKTFEAKTPITNFQKQQNAALQTAYQEATSSFIKGEPTDTAAISGAKTNFQHYLTSLQLEQNAAFDNLMKGFQSSLQILSDEQKAPNGKDAETTYNEMQKLRREQTAALQDFLQQSQGAADRNISSGTFAANLKATGASDQEVAQVQQQLKESLQKQRKKQQDDFDNVYKAVLLDEQAKLMTEQSKNIFIQKEFIDPYQEQGLMEKPLTLGIGDAAPTGEPLQMPAPLNGGRMATKVDGHYFIVNDKGGVHIDVRGLSRDDRMIYLRSALSYYPANGINTIDFNSSDPELIDDVIEVATKLGITVKNQNARPSIPADRWFESRKEPVAVTLAKWQALKEEFEKDLQITPNDGGKPAKFTDLSQTVENVDNLSLQVKQGLRNLKFPEDLNDIGKSSRDAGVTDNFTPQETLNKLQQLENLHKTHTDHLGRLVKNLDQLSDQLKIQADNYKFALSDTDSLNLSRNVHAGAIYSLKTTFLPLVKKFVQKVNGLSNAQADQYAEQEHTNYRHQHGLKEPVDLNELSSEAAEKIESLRVTMQTESIEKNTLSLVENYKEVEKELLREYNFLRGNIRELEQVYGPSMTSPGVDLDLKQKYDTLLADYRTRLGIIESHLEFSTPNDPSSAKLASRYTDKMENTVENVMQKIPSIADKQAFPSHGM